MSFSENLKRARQRAGLSQRDLANMSGVSQSAISAIEKFNRSPSETTMKMLSEALGISVADLIDPSEAEAAPTVSLTVAERQLLDLFRALSCERQNEAVEHLRYLAYRQSEENKKASAV